jgi:Ca2+/Na+ antiporter
MELEELKILWKKSEQEFQPKNEIEIASMLKGRSSSIVDKLKRSVWFELVFTLVVSAALLMYAVTLAPGALQWASISILFIFLAYVFYYVKKIILLNRFDPGNDNIRENLISLTDSLTGYLKVYKRSYTLLYPVFFCLFLLFKGIERGAEKFFETLAKPETIIQLLGLAAVYFFISTWVTNWYLKKLYGNHLEKLKSLLNDIHG